MAPFDGHLARPLLEALDAELVARYDNEDEVFPVHRAVDFAPPRGTFLLATDDGVAVGCAGLRATSSGETAEVKRMYVTPAARGRRLGEQLLDALLDAARQLGYARLILETGLRQPEAIVLYERTGWTRIPPYGDYRNSPLSVCFGREL